ncbi:response regulator transcription factor [Actinomyces wuliandei]|uniref:response regulator transcription factor n=1 Tax=Actinomyces wuliandei TaxID=2057743 RepID=UPI000FDB3A55|nr:response regulator transcription factor [Actinomyces wuliandei]
MISIGIADDDALVRRTLADLLARNEDVSVTWNAKDGQEALEYIRSPEVPAVQAVLLDVHMPQPDGLTLATTLQDEAPDLAVLILTTFVNDSIIERAMAAGVRGFVAKEDGITSLARTIRQAVDGNLVLSPTSSAFVTRRYQADQADATSSPGTALPAPSEAFHEVRLSEREQEVLALLVDALSNKQIASQLTLSEATVKTHVSTIIAKLGVPDRVGAAVYALRHNLV